MKWLTFLNDEDGFSSKDFIMVAFIGVYLLEQVAVFVYSLYGHVDSDTLKIVSSLDPIVMTVIGGIFSVHAVKEFKKEPGSK